jgi:hypothetical protein
VKEIAANVLGVGRTRVGHNRCRIVARRLLWIIDFIGDALGCRPEYTQPQFRDVVLIDALDCLASTRFTGGDIHFFRSQASSSFLTTGQSDAKAAEAPVDRLEQFMWIPFERIPVWRARHAAQPLLLEHWAR